MSVPVETNPFDFQLCYIDSRDKFAWFTSVPLENQWGDDWDDAPYEHNAGTPYDHHYDPPYVSGKSDNRLVEHPLVTVAWMSDSHDVPCDNYTNSPHSVASINRGNVAWLMVSSWRDNDKARAIPAGTKLRDFVRLLKEAGGDVYIPTDLTVKYLEECVQSGDNP